MRIEWTIPCTTVTIREGLLTLENGDFNRLALPELPGDVGFIVATKFQGLPEDFTEDADRRVEVVLASPAMGVIDTLEFDAPTFEPSDEHPEGWMVSRVLPVAIRFTAEAEGAHSIDFYVRGRYQQGKTDPLWITVAP